jgi:KaiC domain protein
MSDDDSADDDWFEGVFADETEQSADTDTDSDADTTPADDASDSPFGDTGAGEFDGSDPFGDDSGPFEDDGGSDDALFEESFGDAMGGGGDDSEDFDDDIDSNIPRLDVGIEGLDNMIQGGVPERHLMVVIGGAGTGKTTVGLQFLRHGLNMDDTEKGVFITLEQTHESIMATAEERGWEFRRHEAEGNLAVVDLDPVEMANSLDNIRGELQQLIEEFGADRFVLDSVSLLEMMYDQQARRRTEVFDFTQSLKEAGVTTVFTSEASEDNPYASRHGIIEYLTDAVFLLRYVRSETKETRLAVEIQKIRNANHSRETRPYEITLEGISVYEQANIF